MDEIMTETLEGDALWVRAYPEVLEETEIFW